jgi:hypothetical protein
LPREGRCKALKMLSNLVADLTVEPGFLRLGNDGKIATRGKPDRRAGGRELRLVLRQFEVRISPKDGRRLRVRGKLTR